MGKLHTHYDNLKVARDAPPEVIRAAYKSLCKKFHPDHHQQDPQATHNFQLINAAYAVLSDQERRRAHDLWIARTEAGLQAAEAQAAAKRAEARARQQSTRRKASRQQELQMAELAGWLRRPARNLAFWTSLLMISVLLTMLIQA